MRAQASQVVSQRAARLEGVAMATKPRTLMTVNVFVSDAQVLTVMHEMFRNVLGFDECRPPLAHEGRTVASVTDDYTTLNFWGLPTISRARKLFARPAFARVTSVCVHTKGNNAEISLGGNASLWKLSLGNAPKISPTLYLDAHCDSVSIEPEPSLSHLPLLKEVVLGFQSNTDFSVANELCGHASAVFPGVHRFSEHAPVLRLIPTVTSSLVFHVNDILLAEKALAAYSAHGGRIGFNGATSGQVLISPPCTGIDLRVCNKIDTASHFNEGDDVLLEEVIRGVGDVPHTSQLGCGQVLRKEMIGLIGRDKL